MLHIEPNKKLLKLLRTFAVRNKSRVLAPTDQPRLFPRLDSHSDDMAISNYGVNSLAEHQIPPDLDLATCKTNIWRHLEYCCQCSLCRSKTRSTHRGNRMRLWPPFCLSASPHLYDVETTSTSHKRAFKTKSPPSLLTNNLRSFCPFVQTTQLHYKHPITHKY